MNATFLAMLGTPELILVPVIVVVVFGVGKLPTVGRQLGEGIKNFKKELHTGEEGEETPELEAEPEDQDSTPRDVTEETTVTS